MTQTPDTRHPEPGTVPETGDNPGTGHLARLPAVLRFLGMLILGGAIGTYLFQHWESGDSLLRYGTLMGLTLALAAAGFFNGTALREGKGARVLLGASLASLPAHFASLGGLLYSRFAWDGVQPAYPGLAVWQAPSDGTALLVLAGATALLLPVTWLALMPLARRFAAPLTGVLAAGGALVLLPVREPGVIAGLALALLTLLGWLELRLWRRQVTLRTAEGGFVRLLLLSPLAVLVGRTLWLYQPHAFLLAVAALAVFAVMVLGAVLYATHPVLRRSLLYGSMVPAAVASLFAATGLVQQAPGLLPWFALLVAAPLSGALALLSVVAPEGGAAYRRGAAFVAVAGVLGNLALGQAAGAALVSLAVGLGTLSYGYALQQKGILALGILATATGLVHQLVLVVQVFDLGHWAGLAALGVAVVMGASLLERHGGRLLARMRGARARLAHWQY